MKNLKKIIPKIIFGIKARLLLISFIVSLISVLLILLKLINFNILIGFSAIPTLNLLFESLVLFSTIYCLLFLPSFPLFFIIFRKKDFTLLVKLSLTIVVNLSYYILLGYLVFFITNEITGYSIYFSMIFTFLSLILYIFLVEIKTRKFYLFKSYKSSIPTDFNYDNFSLLNLIRNKIHLTGILLIIFLFLNSILTVVRYDFFYGTDPWLHITIIKMISEMNFLPVNEYYGSLGFHIFSSIIHFFSGVDIILIPKYFTFYTIFLSALVFYNLLKKIFKNEDLAIFGVFLLEFSYLGFNYMMYQYWPSSLVLIQCLFIFYMLYNRLLNFVKTNRPTKKIIGKDIFFNYSIIILIFISATLAHSLNSLILLILFLGIFFIYFINDVRRGIDFILLLILSIIFIIILQFDLGTGHFWFIYDILLYWKELFFLIFILALPVGFLLWKIKRSILFTTGRYEAVIKGQTLSNYKTIEDKFFIPITFIVVIIITILFFIGNLLFFKVPSIFLLVVIQALFLIIFGIWGIVLFQKKPNGKIFLIWILSFALVFTPVLVYEFFFLNQYYFVRIFNISSSIFAIGCVAYVYKLITLKKIRRNKVRLFFIIFILFSLLTSYIQEFYAIEEVSLEEQEVSSIQWFAANNNNKSVIITESGLNYIFIYYDYPYNFNSYVLQVNEIHYFLEYDLDLFPPENHFEKNGSNILQNLKNQYNSDVYLTIDNEYILNVAWEIYGWLTNEQIEKYYSLSYLNKIYSAKNKFGEENPLYWVI